VLCFASVRLQGFAAAEVEPLLQRLQMSSLLKDLPRMQQLMGGAAAEDPELMAQLPTALQQLAASAAVLKEQLGGEGPATYQQQPQQQQSGSDLPVVPPADDTLNDGGSVSSDSSNAAVQPSAVGSVVSGPGGGSHNVLAAVPAVRLISSLQGLQALLTELQQLQQVRLDQPGRMGPRPQSAGVNG
jgi:hypothetical protein